MKTTKFRFVSSLEHTKKHTTLLSTVISGCINQARHRILWTSTTLVTETRRLRESPNTSSFSLARNRSWAVVHSSITCTRIVLQLTDSGTVCGASCASTTVAWD